MALKSETATFGEHTFEVTQLPYSRGHRVLLRLFKALGPGLAEALSKFPALQGRELGTLDVTEIAQVFAAGAERLANDLSDEDFDFVTDELAEFSFLKKGERKLPLKNEREFLFAGDYLLMFQWLGFALRVNFFGFLKGRDVIAEGLARLQAQQESRSPLD